MARLPNYNLIYLTTYKDIYKTIINDDDDFKKKCVKSSINDEIKKLTKTNLKEFKEIDIGKFDFIVMGDGKVKQFMNEIVKKYGLIEIDYVGIKDEQIKNIIDSEELHLMFYLLNKRSSKNKLRFDKKHLLELDSLLSDYSYVNDCKYIIIAKVDYSNKY